MEYTSRKKVKEFVSLFMFLNRYSWPVLRHELIFLLIVYIFDGGNWGVKASKITHVLKRGDIVTQSDRNKTWVAGRNLIRKNLLQSSKRGYYNITIMGRYHAQTLLKEMEESFDGFKLFHL